MSPTQQVLLIILDGWRLSTDASPSAIAQAHTPYIDYLYQTYPHSQLEASGPAVGLPIGQMGNSEVGHQHLGAGRTVDQDLVRINRAIQNGQLETNPALSQAIAYANQRQKPLHLLGLLSDGGIHSHLDHLKGLCHHLKTRDVPPVYIHAFTDGRDAGIHQARHFIHQLLPFTDTGHIRLASLVGRYYAMDRDQRWERTQIAYDAWINGKGIHTTSWEQALTQSYEAGITDEFIKPIIIPDEKGTITTIQPGDVVICFNFRTDRSRQLTQALTQLDLPAYNMNCLPLYYLTLTVYDEQFRNIPAIFPKATLPNTLGEVVSQHNKKQLRIAESEKYPHVTYFFSGGREAPFPGEERIVIPSPTVATYDLAPAMSAFTLTDRVKTALDQRQFDFICLNFANPDMVGHTGNWHATVEACQAVDQCVSQVADAALRNQYSTLLVSDHGNAETMLQADGTIHTTHTTNPVPCIHIAHQPIKKLHPGTLADVAPTILQLMQLPIPREMQGQPLY